MGLGKRGGQVLGLMAGALPRGLMLQLLLLMPWLSQLRASGLCT